MTNDPTKPPPLDMNDSTSESMTIIDSTMTDDPTKQFHEECGKAFAENPDLHSQLVDLRHEIAELRELLRSANCKARLMLAFSIFNLAALGVAYLMWVLT